MIVKSFDLKFTGWVSLKRTALTLCLMNSDVPTEENIREYKENMLKKMLEEHDGKHYIGKNVFIKIPTWFDESEKSHDKPQYLPYPRVRNLKSIIFDLVKNEDSLLNIEEYISLLSVRIPGKNLKKYGDILNFNDE